MILSSGAHFVLETLQSHGYSAWVVGGAVRDTLMGNVPADFDIAATALPEETAACFAESSVLPTGIRHGTVTVLWHGEAIEVTTLRSDGLYDDGRHPQKVTFVENPEQDLARRDFTINAMAWNEETGLLDPFGGGDDIKNRLLRCVGDPVLRLGEDSLRVLRALRFAAVLNFRIEDKTARALHRQKEGLRGVSAERITAELYKLLCGQAAAKVMWEYQDIFEVILAEIVPNIENNRIALLEKLPCDPLLRLALLLPAHGAVARSAAARLHLSRQQCRKLTAIVNLAGGSDWRDGELVAGLLRVNSCYSIDMLTVTGGELCAIGIPAGPQIGAIMKKLLWLVAEGRCANERETLLEFARQM